MFEDWLVRMLRQRPKGTQSALAAYLGIDPSGMTLMTKGRRKIASEELVRISEFFGESPPEFWKFAPRAGGGYEQLLPELSIGFGEEGNTSFGNLYVRGEIAIGRWNEADRFGGGQLAGVPPILADHAWIVRDDSLEGIARDGEYLLGRDMEEGEILRHGALVVTRRVGGMGNLVETSVRRVRRHHDRTELIIDLPDRAQDPLILDGEGADANVSVAGVVLGVYRALDGLR